MRTPVHKDSTFNLNVFLKSPCAGSRTEWFVGLGIEPIGVAQPGAHAQ